MKGSNEFQQKISLLDNITTNNNTLFNTSTGHSITINGKNGKMLIDLIKKGTNFNHLENLFGNEILNIIHSLHDQGYIYYGTNGVNDEINPIELVSNKMNTFFGLPTSNLSYDIDNLKSSKIGLLGLSSFPGSPYHSISNKSTEAIRISSTSLFNFDIGEDGKINSIVGKYSKYINNKVIVDYGDIPMTINQSLMINRLNKIGGELLSSNIIPLFVGGDHLVTFYLIKGYLDLEYSDDIQIIQFDAHKDTGYSRWNMPEHGSFIRELVLDKKVKRVLQIGVRGIKNKLEMDSLHEKVIECTINNFLDYIIPDIPIYLTIDVDCIDPTIMEAVSYPINNGLTLKNFDDLIPKMFNLKIIGADIVEYDEKYDSSNLRSACTASEIILHELAILGGY